VELLGQAGIVLFPGAHPPAPEVGGSVSKVEMN